MKLTEDQYLRLMTAAEEKPEDTAREVIKYLDSLKGRKVQSFYRLREDIEQIRVGNNAVYHRYASTQAEALQFLITNAYLKSEELGVF